MSQSSTIGAERATPQASRATKSTGRAVLLLAIFVLLGISLLNALDDGPVIETTTQAASNQAAATPAAPVAPPVTALQARSPSEVKVFVANGTGVTGIGAKVAGRLQPVGYQLLKPGNTVNKETNSFVEYAPGYQLEAQGVATALGLPAAAVQPIPATAPVADLQGGQVLVIVGTELANSPQTQAAQPQAGTQTNSSPTTTAVNSNPAVNGPLSRLPGVTTGANGATGTTVPVTSASH